MADDERLRSVDEFRGLSVLLMALANYLSGAQIVPAWLKHAPDIGFTVIDVIAPMFMVAIGLTMGPSFRRRLERDGLRRTVEHFITRNLALVGLGALLTVIGDRTGIRPDASQWGLLQAIGLAGLLSLSVIRLRPVVRLVCGILLLAIYQVLLDHFWLQQVLASTHGGIQGALSWSAMLIMATVLGDIGAPRRQGGRRTLWLSLGLVGAGLLLTLVVSVSKNRVSASYVLLSLGISGLVVEMFAWIDRTTPRVLSFLRSWGRNALFLYLLHGALLGLFAVPAVPSWYVAAPSWLIALQTVMLVTILEAAAWWLDRRKLYFSL